MMRLPGADFGLAPTKVVGMTKARMTSSSSQHRPIARGLLVTLMVALPLLGVLLCALFFRLQAQVGPTPFPTEPGNRIEVLPEPGRELALADVLSPEWADRFVPLQPGWRGDRIRTATWYRVTLRNPEPEVRTQALAFPDIYQEHVTLYRKDGRGGYVSEVTGEWTTWQERSIPGSLLGFDLPLAPERDTVFHLKVAGSSIRPDGFHFWERARDFHTYAQNLVVSYAIYAGVWAGLLGYNLLLYAILRRRELLYYVFYVASFGLLIFTGGNMNNVLWAWPVWPLRSMVVWLGFYLTIFTLVLFSRRFLRTPDRTPRFDRVLRVVQWIWGVGVVLCIFSLIPWFGWLDDALFHGSFPLVAATFPLLLVAGALCWRRGDATAGLYLYTFVPVLMGVVWVTYVNSMAVIEEHFAVGPLVIVGALELILLSLALAYHYRNIEAENARIKAERTEQLEREVAARTVELSELAEKLRQSNRFKDRLFAILGHDLRSPVANTITLTAELADPANGLPPAEAGLFATLRDSNEQLLALLDQLLAWARAESGEVALQPGRHALAELVAPVLPVLRPLWESKRITLELRLAPDLHVRADANTVQTVVRNLLSNAIKFTPADGRITVEAAATGAQVELRVSDSGVGMSPERLAALDQPGGTVSEAGTEQEKGAGFGLALCRSFAALNHGSLRLESAPGRGTTAILTLPRE